MDKIKKSEKTYNEWLMQKTASDERMMYSVKRMDLLTISISGAVIFIVFQILQFIHTKDYQDTFNNLFLLKAAGGLGVLSILVNFASQLYGLKANKTAYNLANYKCWLLKHKKENDDKFHSIKCDRNSKRKSVRILNNMSTSIMLLAVASIVAFSIINL